MPDIKDSLVSAGLAAAGTAIFGFGAPLLGPAAITSTVAKGVLKKALLAGGTTFIGSLLGGKVMPSERFNTRLSLSPNQVTRYLYGDVLADGWVAWASSKRFEADTLNLEAIDNSEPVTVLSLLVWLSNDKIHSLDALSIDGFYTELDNPFDTAANYYVPRSENNPFYENLFVEPAFDTTNPPGFLSQHYPNLFGTGFQGAPGHSYVHLGLVYRDGNYFQGNFPDFLFRVKGVELKDLSKYSDKNASKVWTANAYSVAHHAYQKFGGFTEGQLDAYTLLRGYNHAAHIIQNDTHFYNDITSGPIVYGDGHDTLYKDYRDWSRLYEYNGQFSSRDSFEQIRRDLDAVTNGKSYLRGSKVHFFPGANTSFTDAPMHITDDDVAGGVENIKVLAQPKGNELFNALRFNLAQSQPNKFQETSIEVQHDLAIERDGGKVIPKHVDSIRGITDPFNALRIQSQILRNAYQTLKVELPLGDKKFLRLKPEQGVLYSSKFYGLSNLPCKVIYAEKSKTEPTYIILEWTPPNKYSNEIDLTKVNFEKVPFSSTGPSSPSELMENVTREYSLTKEILTAHIAWHAGRDVSEAIYRWKKSSDEDWIQTIRVPLGLTGIQRQILGEVIVDTDYVYEIQHIDALGRKSAWVQETFNSTTDDTAPDKPVIPNGGSGAGVGFYSIRWNDPTNTFGDVTSEAQDYDHTRIYQGSMTGFAHGSVNEVWRGTDRPAYISGRGAGEHFVKITHVDTSGNESDAVEISLTVGAVSITGNNFYLLSTAGAPADDFGNNGDTARDPNGAFYEKEMGSWSQKGSATPGAINYSDAGDPLGPTETPADFAFSADTVLRTGDMFFAGDGRVWRYDGTSWDFVGNYKGDVGEGFREVRLYQTVGITTKSFPSKPTLSGNGAATYTHSTGVFTDIGSWSPTFPTYVATTHKVVCIIVLVTTENRIVSITDPIVCDNPDDLNVVFIRTATDLSSTAVSTGATRIPTGWSDDPPAGTDQLWARSVLRKFNDTVFTYGKPYRAEGQHGADGVSYREHTIYRRVGLEEANGSAPTGGTYDYDATTPLTPPAGWSETFPLYNAKNQKVLCSIATGDSNDKLSGWSTPRICATEGDLNIVFQRKATAPAKPANTANNTNNGVPTGWVDDEGSTSGTFTLWASIGHRAAGSNAWTWGTPYIAGGKDGINGIDGVSYREHTIYKKVGLQTANGSAPTGGTYDYDATTPLTPPAGWSETFPSYNAQTEKVLCSIATGTNNDTLSTWSTPRICATEGDLNIVFQRKATAPAKPADTANDTNSGVPSGWVDGEGSTSGSHTLWASVGHRSAGSNTWSWGTPYIAGGKDGINGVDGVSYREHTIYKKVGLETANGSAPSGGTYDYDAATPLTPPSGWSETFPSFNNQTEKVLCSIATGTNNDTLSSWSTPRICATDGDLNVVFQRKATAPGKPANTANNTNNGVPTGWVDDESSTSGTHTLWASVGHRTAGSNTWTWRTPYVAGSKDGVNGVDGVSYREHTIYKKVGLETANGSAPSGGSYDYSAETPLTPPSGWSEAFPSFNTRMEKVLCSAATGTNNDTLSSWSTPRICAADGDLNIVFQRSATKPAKPANTANSTNSGVPTDWVDDEGSTSGTHTLWASVGHRAAGSNAWVWGTPYIAGGKDGINGVDGVSYREHTIYKKVGLETADGSAPTGGTYDYDASTPLTPPTGWSETFPSFNTRMEKVLCSIATGTNNDKLSSWSTPRVCAADGDLNIVYQRSATKPAKPADTANQTSNGVPTGWVDDEGSTSSTNTLWASVGHRTAGSNTWSWGTPYKIEGIDGVDGSDGIPGYSRTLGYERIITSGTSIGLYPSHLGWYKFHDNDSATDTGENTFQGIKDSSFLDLAIAENTTFEDATNFDNLVAWADFYSKIEVGTLITFLRDTDNWLSFQITSKKATTQETPLSIRVTFGISFVSSKGDLTQSISTSKDESVVLGVNAPPEKGEPGVDGVAEPSPPGFNTLYTYDKIITTVAGFDNSVAGRYKIVKNDTSGAFTTRGHSSFSELEDAKTLFLGLPSDFDLTGTATERLQRALEFVSDVNVRINVGTVITLHASEDKWISYKITKRSLSGAVLRYGIEYASRTPGTHSFGATESVEIRTNEVQRATKVTVGTKPTVGVREGDVNIDDDGDVEEADSTGSFTSTGVNIKGASGTRGTRVTVGTTPTTDILEGDVNIKMDGDLEKAGSDDTFTDTGVNIVGDKGDPGDKGNPGDKGDPGDQGISYQEVHVYKKVGLETANGSAPTGGSFSYSAGGGTLTAPSGWSTSYPNNFNRKTEKVLRSDATGDSNDGLSAWSTPYIVNATSEVTIVWRRSATAPSKPGDTSNNTNKGVPTGWSATEAGTSGSNPLYASVGERAAGSNTWVWDNPYKVEGVDGIKGTDGTDGEDGIGYEVIFAIHSSQTLNANQMPLGTWGFDEPETRNGVKWTDGLNRDDITTTNPYAFQARRVITGAPSKGDTISGSWSVARVSGLGPPGPKGDAGTGGGGATTVQGFTGVAGSNEGEIDLSWTALTGATNYRITGFHANTLNAINFLAGNVTSHTIVGLRPGESYFLSVSAVLASGEGSPSSAIEVRANGLIEGLPPPNTPTVSQITHNSARISWGYNTREIGDDVTIDIATNDTFTSGVKTKTLPSGGTITQTQFTGLTINTRYYIRIRERFGNSYTPYVLGDFKTASTVVSKPSNAPTGIAKEAEEEFTVTSYDAETGESTGESETVQGHYLIYANLPSQSDIVSGADIEVTTANGTEVLSVDIPFINRNFNQLHISTIGPYLTSNGIASLPLNVRVRWKNASGAGPWSLSVGNYTSRLAAPSLRVSSGSGRATCTWANVTNGNLYELQYKRSSASNWTGASDDTSPSIITGLSNGISYDFRVRALANGRYTVSPWSTVVTVTPSTSTSKLATPSLRVSAGNARATCTWGGVTNGNNYELQYKLRSASSWTGASDDTSPSIITGLTNGAVYDFRVRAVGYSTYTTSNWSTTVSATPSAGTTATDTTPDNFDFGFPDNQDGDTQTLNTNTVTISGINATTSGSFSADAFENENSTGTTLLFYKNGSLLATINLDGGGTVVMYNFTVVNGDQLYFQTAVTDNAIALGSGYITINIGGVTDTVSWPYAE